MQKEKEEKTIEENPDEIIIKKKKKVVKKTVKKLVKKTIPVENIKDYPNIVSISETRPMPTDYYSSSNRVKNPVSTNNNTNQNNFISQGPRVYHREKDNTKNDLNNTDIKPNEERRYKGSVSRREYLNNTPDIYKKGKIKLGNESDENDENNPSNVRKIRNLKGNKLKGGDNLPGEDNKDENDNLPKRDNNSIKKKRILREPKLKYENMEKEYKELKDKCIIIENEKKVLNEQLNKKNEEKEELIKKLMEIDNENQELKKKSQIENKNRNQLIWKMSYFNYAI